MRSRAALAELLRALPVLLGLPGFGESGVRDAARLLILCMPNVQTVAVRRLRGTNRMPSRRTPPSTTLVCHALLLVAATEAEGESKSGAMAAGGSASGEDKPDFNAPPLCWR
ncbi:unnamed protein product [Phaeothamnion confervicola]